MHHQLPFKKYRHEQYKCIILKSLYFFLSSYLFFGVTKVALYEKKKRSFLSAKGIFNVRAVDK